MKPIYTILMKLSQTSWLVGRIESSLFLVNHIDDESGKNGEGEDPNFG